MSRIKKILIVITTIVVLFVSSLTMPMQKASAAVPAILKIVGGETADQVLQGMAYQLGASFNDESSQDLARQRWNLDGYNKAKEFEQQLNEEEIERWNKFNNEIKNVEIKPTSKPGIGKVVLSGLTFLTGLDLIYNSYSAFMSGYESGQIDVMNDEQTGLSLQTGVQYTDLPYISVSKSLQMGEKGGLFAIISFDFPILGSTSTSHFLTISLTSAQVDGNPYVSGFYTQLENSGSSQMVRLYAVISATGVADKSQYLAGMSLIDYMQFIENPPTVDIRSANLPPNAWYIPNLAPTPAIESLPKIDGAIVPDISKILPYVKPDSIVEIEVPMPGTTVNPVPLIEPITPGQIDELIDYTIPGIPIDPEKIPDIPNENDTDTEKNKPIIPTPNPDNPPYPGIDADKKPQEEVPEYPEKTETTETPGLFEKLWEWLKSILDVLFKILAAIIALPFTLLELLWDFAFNIAKALFVPSDGFWDENMNELKKVIWSDEIDNMIDGFESLGSGGGGMFKDIVVSLMGVDGLIVIDSDSINSILENIHSWVRGVFYPLLILFNVNSMYKLIRGTSLVEATRGLANRSKGAE